MVECWWSVGGVFDQHSTPRKPSVHRHSERLGGVLRKNGKTPADTKKGTKGFVTFVPFLLASIYQTVKARGILVVLKQVSEESPSLSTHEHYISTWHTCMVYEGIL